MQRHIAGQSKQIKTAPRMELPMNQIMGSSACRVNLVLSPPLSAVQAEFCATQLATAMSWRSSIFFAMA
jgi:hypothetical protein